MRDDQHEAVWKAMASPHRRQVMDLLRDGPRTTGELAEALEELSRFAVMQHLEVLREAGLLLVRREGRRRLNYLNAVPLQEVYDRFVGRLAGAEAAKATALRRHLEDEAAPARAAEGEENMATATTSETIRTVRIQSEIRVKAAPERVFEALTTEQDQWYPHYYGPERLRGVVFEPRVGGQIYEDWGDGMGISYGTVTYWDPPAVVGTRGLLRGGITTENWYTLEADGEETVLKQSFVAFGDIADEMAAAIRSHGDIAVFGDAFRGWVEQGIARAG